MPKFGARSLALLALCDDRLQRVLTMAIEVTDFSIVETFRDEAAQEKAFAEHRSQKHWPNSKHNTEPCQAADIMPYSESDGIDWSDTPENYERMARLAGIVQTFGHLLKIPIRWGGDWNMNDDTRDERFRDRDHIELA